MHQTSLPRYTSPKARFRALADRDPRAREAFVYAVATTGVVCKPGCASRAPRPENVVFFDDVAQAERAGFRRCKRCFREAPRARVLARACRLLERPDEESALTTAAVAAAVGTSPSQLVRAFREELDVTPQQYRRRVRAERARAALAQSGSVTEAVYRAGYGAPSRFYAGTARELGMRPAALRRGGAGEALRYAVLRSELGEICVAWTRRGVSALFFVNDADEAERELAERLPHAERSRAARPEWIGRVVSAVDQPRAHDIPLDIQGTAFQARVWRALGRIPPGETRSYSELARTLGKAGAARAVARAVASNPVAVLVPCHRVVGKDGELTGYRWGIERKRELLRREREGLPRSRPRIAGRG